MGVRTKSILALILEVMSGGGWIFCALHENWLGYVFCMAVFWLSFLYTQGYRLGGSHGSH